jgi:hypothetical protein
MLSISVKRCRVSWCLWVQGTRFVYLVPKHRTVVFDSRDTACSKHQSQQRDVVSLRVDITSGRTVVGKLLSVKCRLRWWRHKSLQGTGNVARRQHEQTQWISDINPTYLFSIWCRIYRIRTADSDYSQFVVVTDVTRCGPLYVLTIYSSPFCVSLLISVF